MGVLITGATGHLGPHLIAEFLRAGDFRHVYVLARRSRAQTAATRVKAVEDVARAQLAARRIAPKRVAVVPLELDDLPAGSATRSALDDVRVVVHAAADTRFTTPLDDLRSSNVNHTLAMCRVAAECRRLEQFLFVSTACVAGRRSGTIPEIALDNSAGFANAYEQTKWEAEEAVIASGLPLRIARLTTCAGSHETGYVHRLGALHHLLRWTARGLVPMIPASADSRLDLISTDIAAAWLSRASARPPGHLDICHVALGPNRIPLEPLLDSVLPMLARDDRTRPLRPLLVDPSVFQAFSDMVRVSGDALFTRVQQSAAAILPTLLYPKTYDTSHAERCWGGPLPHPDWTVLMTRVVEFVRRRSSVELPHV
jgi:nucleoside-diphosphate-sugar epimerase